MTMLSNEEIKQFYEKLEETGLENVKTNLARQIYGQDARKKMAIAWIESKEKEIEEAKYTQVMKHREKNSLREEERFQEILKVTKEQAESARSSAWSAKIAAWVSVIGAIFAFIALIYRK